MATPPTLYAAVRIDREREPNAWEDWRFTVAEVLLDSGEFGSTPRLLRDDGKHSSVLFPGLPVSLHRDEAEGYYLNLSSGGPVWFVKWRVADDDPARSWPEAVTLSYNEAGRMLDAQERVDNQPLPPDVCAWLQAFVDEHYRPEPKRRQRPASFKRPEDR